VYKGHRVRRALKIDVQEWLGKKWGESGEGDRGTKGIKKVMEMEVEF
jgi:hypothetical protein